MANSCQLTPAWPLLLPQDTPTSSGPCGAKVLKLDVGAGGGEVGTELVLATPTY